MVAGSRPERESVRLVSLEVNPPPGVELYTATARSLAVSPDGTRLAFVGVLGGARHVYIRPVDQFAATPVRGSDNAAAAFFSPDGRWIIYVSNESGRNEIYLRGFPGPDRRWQVSTDGGTQAVWNPNGREIFSRSGNRMMAVELSTTPNVALSPPRVLFEQRYAYGAGITIANYDVTRDGQRFVMVKDESTAGRLNVVLNWFQELQRLVPMN